MATPTRLKEERAQASQPRYHGLAPDSLIRIYRTMYLARKLDIGACWTLDRSKRPILWDGWST
jgi:hypothetical protein